MRWVGRKFDAKRNTAAVLEEEYQQGSKAERRAMLVAAEARLLDEAKATLDKSKAAYRKSRTPAQQQLDEWLTKRTHNLISPPTRTSGQLRIRSLPILARSRACYLDSKPATAATATEAAAVATEATVAPSAVATNEKEKSA